MQIFDTLRNFAGSAFDTIKETVTNWSKGSYLAPGMRYCGPGNPLNNGEPVDESDRACQAHDYEYDHFKREKDAGRINTSELNTLVRESDNRLIDNLRKASGRGLGSYMAEFMIGAKKKAEDWGLLNPSKFVV